MVPAALWCVANWSVTSLMNGSGNVNGFMAPAIRLLLCFCLCLL
ncbi:MAG: hypothetical protein ACLR56_08925 [Oscillospiraceae bacterium]